jgi:hypothetical protein
VGQVVLEETVGKAETEDWEEPFLLHAILVLEVLEEMEVAVETGDKEVLVQMELHTNFMSILEVSQWCSKIFTVFLSL